MPFNGSGTFNRVMNWVADAAANVKIKADRHDQEDDNLAAGLSNVICRDGQSQITADIPWNGHRLTGVGNPVDPQDAVTKQVMDQGFTSKGLNDIKVNVVTTSANYVKPPNLRFLEVIVVGGGAGGTGTQSTPAGQSAAGGGGGGGGTVIKLYSAADLDATEPYTVGANGGSPGGSGAAGGASTFKGLAAGGGGAPAAVGTGGSAPGATIAGNTGGSGGTATGGDINIAGGNATNGLRAVHGTATNAIPGVGGTSFLTQPNIQGQFVLGSNYPGVNGRFPGGGGSGGAIGASQTFVSGSAGGGACIIFKEYF